ncbi:hypothetical protein DRN85_01040 [Methanosarcinales archaeon]|nr:MAG: hypothetical protein DRN85_01040 [Methanosarcinales archaeon]
MTEQNNDNSNEENCPLTPSDWVMLLSGEINSEDSRNSINNIVSTVALLVVFALSLISIMLAVRTTNLPDANINHILSVLRNSIYIIGVICMGYFVYMIDFVFRRRPKVQKNGEKLKNLREDVISGRLTNSNKIREKWEDMNKNGLKDQKVE